MKFKKVLLLGLSLGIMWGCSTSGSDVVSQNKSSELYDGLNAQETYQKACNYFNENVTSCTEISFETPKGGERSNPGVVYAKTYQENGKKSASISWVSEHISIFTVFHDNKYYEQSFDDIIEYTEEKQKKLYNERQGPIIKPLLESSEDEMSKTEFINVNRHNEGDEIIISVKYKRSLATEYADGTKEWGKNICFIRNIYIGKDGLIYKTVGKECDDNFKDEYIIFTAIISDINKKNSFSYDEEIGNIKKYENMTLEEFKKELGI